MVLLANRNSPVVFDINQLATVSLYQLSIAHQEFNVANTASRMADFSDFRPGPGVAGCGSKCSSRARFAFNINIYSRRGAGNAEVAVI